jgi:hypothetical protein
MGLEGVNCWRTSDGLLCTCNGPSRSVKCGDFHLAIYQLLLIWLRISDSSKCWSCRLLAVSRLADYAVQNQKPNAENAVFAAGTRCVLKQGSSSLVRRPTARTALMDRLPRALSVQATFPGSMPRPRPQSLQVTYFDIFRTTARSICAVASVPVAHDPYFER